MIRKIHLGQPIYNSKKFKVGDILLAINDQIIEGMTHQEVLSVIRNAPKFIRIIAKRPLKIPNELFINSRPVSPEKLLQDFQQKDIQSE